MPDDTQNPLQDLDEETLLRELKENNPEELAEEADMFSLGERMREWVESDAIGKYLFNRIDLIITEESSNLFAETTPDTKEARRAHFEIKKAQGILNLIQEAVERGRAAEELLVTADNMDAEIESLERQIELEGQP